MILNGKLMKYLLTAANQQNIEFVNASKLNCIKYSEYSEAHADNECMPMMAKRLLTWIVYGSELILRRQWEIQVAIRITNVYYFT